MSAVVTSGRELLYFGKVPARGDFVRSAGQSALIGSIDRWQSQAMDRLAADPRWKRVYDAAPPVQFAIVGTASQVGLAGHWMASQDASGRRFPFVTAGAFNLPSLRDFASLAPLALAGMWTMLAQRARAAHAAADMDQAHASLHAPLGVAVDPEAARIALHGFLQAHTVASLAQMLEASGTRFDVRQATLALGVLLRPAMTQGTSRLTRLLCLPLVRDPALKPAVAAYWVSLVACFFQRHAVEMSLFIASVGERPYLLLGFQGASAAALHAVIDPALLAQQAVFLDMSDWVEDEVQIDAGLRKLSNYMRDPGLSLSQVLSTYREVFLGARCE